MGAIIGWREKSATNKEPSFDSSDVCKSTICPATAPMSVKHKALASSFQHYSALRVSSTHALIQDRHTVLAFTHLTRDKFTDRHFFLQMPQGAGGLNYC